MSKNKNFRKRGDADGDGGDATTAADPAAGEHKLLREASRSGRKQQLLSFTDDEDPDPLPATPAAAASGKKNATASSAARGKPPRKPASSALLSFDSEGDNSLREKKRSAGYGTGHGSGHKVGMVATKDKAQAVSNVLPQAGEYTPERLQELQKNTIRLGGAKIVAAEPKPNPAEPLVILKGVIKPATSEGGETSSIEVTTSTDVPVVVSDDGIDAATFDAATFGDAIPDAAAIAAAKAQRERRRIAHSAPDYIPLGSSEGGELRSRVATEAAVSKKDEAVSSDDDAEEVRGRLSFIGQTNNGKKVGVFDFVESVDEEDEEEKLWEEEQLKKGVGKRVDDSSGRNIPLLAGGAYGQAAAKPLVQHMFTVDQQAESAMLALQQGLKRLQESHARTQSDLHSVEQNLSFSAASITVLEEKFSSAGKKYIYMQQLRDFVSTLCDFLQAKSPLIEELEDYMQKLHEERADAVFQRRILDSADEKAQLDSAVGAALAVLSSGGSMQTASAHAVSATQAAAAAALNDIPSELDEFGRDTSLQKRMEMKSRAEARKRRISRVLAKSSTEECSSDESDGEMAFDSGRGEALETAERIFSDSSEEFSQLELIKDRLTKWHREYPATYTDAYVSMSAPAIFAPFVRLELLRWDPLRDNAGFENMKWHSLLCEYDDPDLVPSLVEKVALPLLHHYVGQCWDRFSTRQTRNIVAAVQEVSVYVPATSDGFMGLVALVRNRIAAAVSEAEVPTWNAQLLTAVQQAAEIAEYRFRLAVKLLRNIGMWKNVLSSSKLNQLGLEELLNGRILPHLRVLAPEAAVARSEAVLVALHGTWIGNDPKDLCPELGAFIQHVIRLGKILEKSMTKRDGAALAETVRKMLISLNQQEKGRELAKFFQLKDASVS